jgi:hypothetical protein
MWVLALLGCIDTVNQVAGTGSVYTTRCSAEMTVKGETYEARCEPASCLEGWRSGPVSHVVVAMDPGTKLVGYAERVCIQDLSNATALYTPAGEVEAEVAPKTP